MLDLLRSERMRGASWYLREALKILAEAESPERAVEELRRVRPGMAPLDLIALVVETARRRGVELRRAVEGLLGYAERAQEVLRSTVAGLGLRCPADFVTISFSRAVADFVAVRRDCIKRLYLLESRPGEEAAAAVEEYGRHVDVVPIPDSAVGSVRFDYAVFGLDGLYADGYAFNKVGTLPLLATARAVGAASIAVFESYKAAPLPSPEPYRVVAEVLGRRIEIPLFDKFKSSLIDVAATDLGVFERPGGELAERAWAVIEKALGLG
ncbi:MAG: translation initiation factor eIF-2B [Thermoproteus sp.]